MNGLKKDVLHDVNTLSFKKINDGHYGEIPEEENDAILHLSDPMVQSFNYAIGDGLATAVKNIAPVELITNSGRKITIQISNFTIEKPSFRNKFIEDTVSPILYPRQCIEAGSSYDGSFLAAISWVIDGKKYIIEQMMGHLPIMVKSRLCNLHGMKPKELVRHGENVNDPGGYFIVNGSKKVVRLLTAQRRNYPIALVRETWRKKQKDITEKGVIIQCIDTDETTCTNIVHYLSTGNAKFHFIIRKVPYIIDIAIMLKIIIDVTDVEIIGVLASLRGHDTFFIEKMKGMLVELSRQKLFTSQQCRQYIGSSFRKSFGDLPSTCTDEQICDTLIQRYVLIHLKSKEDKFNLLCLMLCKLYSFVAGESVTESVDAFSMMETHLSGFVYLKYLKEQLADYLMSMRWATAIMLEGHGVGYELTEKDLKKLSSMKARDACRAISEFVSTGELKKSKTGIGMTQVTGLSIIMDGLNRMRDLSHLRAIHRGSYFLEMKTVVPRRLTGEAWGFICPVHTPDGAPCGLLNHLTYSCIIPAIPAGNSVSQLTTVLQHLGMIPINTRALCKGVPIVNHYPVIVDGKFVGHILQKDADDIVFHLRAFKTGDQKRNLPAQIYPYTEIVLVKQRPHGGQFPGLFLFTTPARMMRPVINLHTGKEEMIGTFEQLYLNVAIDDEQLSPEIHTHMEIDKTQLFSNIGKLVPFSDCNPNPRNMYQCQMGKQTMGTPLHTWNTQTLSKAYRLTYPQVPLVRNSHYDTIDMQDHCMGFNAILAIISYTGYDIEDAMVINKSAMERGLAHGQVYKTEFIDLVSSRGGVFKEAFEVFKRDPEDKVKAEILDEFGLPMPGTPLQPGKPFYSVFDKRSKTYRVRTYKGEKCVVDKVAILGTTNSKEVTKVSITVRVRRDPNIGDKFASRSGQKGIMSRLYPTEDLPFTERGLMPDIIFNPHGIPSRMTAGKLIEVLAGKAAAEFGVSFDSMPFQFNDERPAAEAYGEILEKAGFNYYGEDIMYSGIDGRMLDVKIYQGIMYYQRLRHMTADKYQVRAGTGPIDPVTRQPVKGRKRGGAIRFGEMERDALIAHGAPFILRDRLLDCSDGSQAWVCKTCGGILTAKPLKKYDDKFGHESRKVFDTPICSLCDGETNMTSVRVPHAFKYLTAELASLGISTKVSTTDVSNPRS